MGAIRVKGVKPLVPATTVPIFPELQRNTGPRAVMLPRHHGKTFTRRMLAQAALAISQLQVPKP